MEASRYNYYDILEISTHCPQHEVTTAFERARQTYSGDNPAIYTIFSDEEARELLRLVEEAYSVLGNKTLRNLYDEKMAQSAIRKEDLSFESLSAQSKIVPLEPLKRPSKEKPSFQVNHLIENEIKNATDWDGALLKKVREYKAFTLEKLSEITKINSYYISAIERMDGENLPAAVFIRGYVGQIAKVLGLDEKKVSDSYMKTFKTKKSG